MISPPAWTSEELDRDRLIAVEAFRNERMLEPIEQYSNLFDEFQGVVEDLLEASLDLAQLDSVALDLLCDKRSALALRYLTGPMISADDLEVLAEGVLTPKQLKASPETVTRIVGIVRAGLDRRRFVWVSEDREPLEHERAAAILATASLIAQNRANTVRRVEGRRSQERAVADRLIAAGLRKVGRREITSLRHAPEAGEFCLECKLGVSGSSRRARKADFIATAWDGRLVAIECKVTNSFRNSIKRLNNDTAAKSASWLKDLGDTQVVPVVVLSGVIKLHNLIDAQSRGLTLIWAHNLEPLVEWLQATRQ